MRTHYSVRGVIFLIMPLFIAASATLAAGQQRSKIATIVEQVKSGELPQAMKDLKALRQQRFPGLDVSGQTCKNKPAFVLLVASERALQAKDRLTSLNYLQQLRCLEVAGQKSRTFDYRKKRLGIDEGFLPELPPICPATTAPGLIALSTAETLLAQNNSHKASTHLLRAACLSGLSHPQVRRVFAGFKGRQVEKRASVAAAELATQTPDAVTAAPAPVMAPDPEPLKTRGPATNLKALINSQQSPGEVAHNVPEKMRLNQSVDVEIRVQQSKVNTAGMRPDFRLDIHEISTTGSMSVELCCGEPAEEFAFDIVPQSLQQQPVTDDEFTQWVFEVTAKKPGDQKLKLIIHGEYTLPGGEVFGKNYPIEIIPIEVKVLTSNASILVIEGVAALLLALLLFWYYRRSINNLPDVFISYRRKDSPGWAQSLHDQLSKSIDRGEIFMDLHDIPPGTDFSQFLKDSLKQTRVVLVVIGKKWLKLTDSDGNPRIMNPDDWVRQEIRVALESGKKVIPVLVDGSDVPPADALPDDIRKLSRLNAVKLHPDFFQEGVDKLVKSIQHPVRSRFFS